MKNFAKVSVLTLLFISALSANLSAQLVANGGFENWVQLPWYDNPEGWVTNNYQIITPVVRDSMAYEGDFAMKVVAAPTGLGLLGEASHTVIIDYIPESLQFYAKWERSASASIRVSIDFYNGESIQYSEVWYADTEFSEWTPVTIMLDQIEPVFTHAIIRVIAEVGDLIPGNGWISVDDMFLGTVDGVGEIDLDVTAIGPVPCDQILTIHQLDPEHIGSEWIIYNIHGMVVYQEEYKNTIDTSSLADGMYFLSIRNEDTWTKKTFIVRH